MLSFHQSGFRPGDSCTHQLISIGHDIYNVCEANPNLEVRGVSLVHFTEIHRSLLEKIKQILNRTITKFCISDDVCLCLFPSTIKASSDWSKQ